MDIKTKLSKEYKNYHKKQAKEKVKTENDKDFEEYVLKVARYGARNGRARQEIIKIKSEAKQYKRVMKNLDFHAKKAAENGLSLEIYRSYEQDGEKKENITAYITGWAPAGNFSTPLKFLPPWLQFPGVKRHEFPFIGDDRANYWFDFWPKYKELSKEDRILYQKEFPGSGEWENVYKEFEDSIFGKSD